MRKIFVFAAACFFALAGSALFAQEGALFYHLLILDRINSPGSDIGDPANATLLYKFRHERNGYLVALYTSPQQEPLALRLPDASRVVANIATAQKAAIREYVNSASFRRYVTHSTVIPQLLGVLERSAADAGSPASGAAAPPVYHLLILDRINSPGSDIGDPANATMLYKFRHGRNGYLVALYTSPQSSALPQLPAGSRIVVNLSTVQKAAVREYVNSAAFRRYVTRSAVTAQLLEDL